jgi:hypothetical protein
VQLKRSCQLHNYNQIFYPQFIVMQLKSWFAHQRAIWILRN